MDPPLVLNQPQTIDFRGAVSAMLPDKKSGPPAWIAAILVMGSLVGGAVLAHRFVDGEAAALGAPPPAAHRKSKAAEMPSTGAEPVAPSAPAAEQEGPSKLAPRPTTELDAETVPLAEEPEPAKTSSGGGKGAGSSPSAKAGKGGKAAKHGKPGKRAKKPVQKRRGKH